MFGGAVASVLGQARGVAVALAVVTLVASGVGGHVSTASALAAAVEPSAIALAPEDLPPGFKIDPTRTSDDTIENVGPRHIRSLARDFTPANLSSGPVAVVQSVIRLEGQIGAGDALRLQRNHWENNVGFKPTAAGPNDGGTFSLEKIDKDVSSYLVGFIKENMIIVTIVVGEPGVVRYTDAVAYAGKSSAKLDAALGR